MDFKFWQINKLFQNNISLKSNGYHKQFTNKDKFNDKFYFQLSQHFIKDLVHNRVQTLFWKFKFNDYKKWYKFYELILEK
jgi:hypothetical protein